MLLENRLASKELLPNLNKQIKKSKVILKRILMI